MSYTAQQLITRSWYLSGIVARGAQSVSGDQITDGLALLNELLDWKAVQTDLIPYWTYYTFPAVANTESYFIENLYEVESLTFNDQTVRYATNFATRRQYFGSSRIDGINSLPFSWTFNRKLNGGTIYLYFLPQSNYPIKIMGKFGLTDVTLTTDLTTVYDKAYIAYLRYALGQYMCSELNVTFNPESEKILRMMANELKDMCPPDLIMRKKSMLTQGSGINFGDINQGQGWRP